MHLFNRIKPGPTILVVTLLAIQLVLATGLSAQATTQDLGGLSDLFALFEQTFSDVQDYLDKILADTLGPLQEEIQNVVDNALGELGLVDPNQARQDMKAQVRETTGDIFRLDPMAAGIQGANELDRQVTRAQVGSLLSEAGQAATRERIEWVENTVAQVGTQAKVAESAISTQQAIKQMAQQHANTAEVLGAVQSELLQSRQDAQMTNINLANISDTLDQETRSRHMGRLGNAIESLKISSQAGLF
ncbi:MAG: hypothetical protein F6K19_41095 [Cyanothece sp. SIO1E1]|nr:hypothetical protein [Cyanothece sp. SIO1E1]